MMRWMPLFEILSGITALLFAGAAFINLSWAEGASSQAMKRESARRTRRLFIICGVFVVATGVFYVLSMR
jgi:hypothetical protein